MAPFVRLQSMSKCRVKPPARQVAVDGTGILGSWVVVVLRSQSSSFFLNPSLQHKRSNLIR